MDSSRPFWGELCDDAAVDDVVAVARFLVGVAAPSVSNAPRVAVVAAAAPDGFGDSLDTALVGEKFHGSLSMRACFMRTGDAPPGLSGVTVAGTGRFPPLGSRLD